MKYSRRNSIDITLKSLGIGVLSALGVATIFPTLFSPESRKKKFNLGRIDNVFRVNSFAEFYLGEKKVILIKRKDSIIAFDSTCTHGGCPVQWNEQSTTFQCACHGGVFDYDGNAISGPPKYPLRRFVLKQRNNGDYIIIDT